MAERQTLELKFEVKSLNKSRKTIEYVKDAQALSGELEHALAEQFPDAKVTIKREEGIPIAPLIQHLIVSIDWHAVMSGVEKAAASFATTQVLTLLKEKFQDLSAKPMSSDDKTAAKKAAKTASKKTAAKTNKGRA
jgi:hypothetical protein